MLEEILKSINSNLERVANALEPKELCIEAPKESPEGIKANEAYVTTNIPQQPINQTQPVAPVANQPQIPVNAQAQSFTQEQLAVAMSNAVSAGKMPIIQEIMQQLGVQALTQVNPADYNKVATMLKEKGVEV